MVPNRVALLAGLFAAFAVVTAQGATDRAIVAGSFQDGDMTAATVSAQEQQPASPLFKHLLADLPAYHWTGLKGPLAGSSDFGDALPTADAISTDDRMPALFSASTSAGGSMEGSSAGGGSTSAVAESIDSPLAGAKAAWRRGDWDLYVSGYAWHLPGSYSTAARHRLNKTTWGGGFGRSIEDQSGNRHMLCFMATQDSHYKPEYFAGYLWQHPLIPDSPVQVDFGITAFLFSRVDVEDGIPLPGILPYLAFGTKRVQVVVLYVPPIGDLIGGQTVCFFGRIQL